MVFVPLLANLTPPFIGQKSTKLSFTGEWMVIGLMMFGYWIFLQ